MKDGFKYYDPEKEGLEVVSQNVTGAVEALEGILHDHKSPFISRRALLRHLNNFRYWKLFLDNMKGEVKHE